MASNELDVHIVNLSSILQEKEFEKPSQAIVNPDVVLKGHLQRVIHLNWSNLEDGKLVSVSYDGTAQVRN